MKRYIQAVRLRPGLPGRTKHATGAPVELRGEPVPMADPALVVISEADDGYFLERYTDAREFAGDTWHQTRAAAVSQAEWEYDGRVGNWVTMGDEAADLDAVLDQLGRVTFADAD